MALLLVVDALFGKPYLWDQHDTYQSQPHKVIVKIQNQWYNIPERQPTSTVAMISSKQIKKLINHAQELRITHQIWEGSKDHRQELRITCQC